MDDIDPTPLVRGRARVKASITKFKKFADDITANTTLIEIDLRLSRIDQLVKEFISYDDILGDLVGYEHEYDEFEDRILSLTNILIQEKNKRVAVVTSTNSTRATSVETNNHESASITNEMIEALTKLTESQQNMVAESAKVKSSFETILPKINIKPFSGDYKDWPTFNDQFSKIHQDTKLTGIQKFTYLRSLLDPEPSLLIEKILLTNDNYDIAWKKLSKRYDNKRKIASSYIESFFKQKVVREGNAEEIRSISDNVENLLAGIDSIDPTKCRDIWLIHVLLNKLDENTRKAWAEKTTESYEKDLLEEKYFPTMNEFLKFLDDRRTTLESIQEYTAVNSKHRNIVNITNKINKARCNFVNNKTCLKCKLPHPLYKCIKFKQFTAQQKREFVSKNLLCFNCLSDGHRASNCTYDKKCQVCNGNHHSMLHIDKSVYQMGSATFEPGSVSKAISSSQEVNKMSVPGRGQQHANSYALAIDHSNMSSLVQVETNMMNNMNKNELNLNVEPFVPCHKNVMVNNNNIDNQKSSVQKGSEKTIENNIMSCKASSSISSLLPTAQVGVGHPEANKTMYCNMLLDSGSQLSFVTESLVNKLKLKRKKSQIIVNGLSSSGSVNTNGVVTLKLSSVYNNESIVIKAFILKNISSNLPAQFIDINKWQQLNTLDLADKNFNCPKRVDVLLGADHFFSVLKPEKINIGKEMPTIQNTIFGWIVAGSFKICANSFKIEINEESNLDISLRKFWELEEVPIQSSSNSFTDEEIYCEENFKKNYYKNEMGKFVVKLPILPQSIELGNSLQSAIRRLLSLEKRFLRDEELLNHYREFINEYIEMGHMTKIPNNEIQIDENKCYYLPHHPVFKLDSQTTKCRVVFDGSNKSLSGISLNDKLAVGPTIQLDLQSILINFRIYKVALCGDIEKMYRQVVVNKEHQEFQRIVWRNNPEQPIQHFRLSTVTYGTASAPFLATRCLKQIGLDCEHTYPIASNVIINNFYVDDLIAGANTIEEATELRHQVSSLLEERGFVLRKWISNSLPVLQSIPSKDSANALVDLNENDKSVKVLGLFWQPIEDYFTFKVNLHEEINCTKRNLLSEASKVFDPMGFLSPSTVAVKIIFQELWLKNFSWDDVLPKEISNRWLKIRNNFKYFESLKISRWLGTSGNKAELIGFSDASELAYSAAIYLKTIDENSKVNINLLFAKTKVAPLKQVSIPRLELCGAHLLTKMYQFIISLHNFKDLNITAFTDSSVVLSWLSSHPRRWKTFVANRTSKIIEVIAASNWKHVKSKDNPADCSSRGISPEQLINHELWWTGPPWLKQNSSSWPISSVNIDSHSTDNEDTIENECRKNVQTFFVQELNNSIDSLFCRISSLSKIVRIICYCRRFIKLSKNKFESFITSDERNIAIKICVKWAQQQMFKSETNLLLSKKPIPRKSSLFVLNPFLDDDGLLRVLGRLEYSNCNYDTKHPFIIPKNHILGKLIVKEFHAKHLHAGPLLVLNIIRQRFWLIGGRNLVKKEINNCVKCTRYKTHTSQQMMANLPKQRVVQSKPFSQSGLDYAGPFTIRWNKGRNSKTNKAYMAIFVCFSTKAVHLELVSDMTSEAFIAALRRFIGRRGIPLNIFSDNGTNFVGAKRQLSSLYYAAFEDRKNVDNFLSDNCINWHMIPPAAPHFGGIWESGVKSVKFHLKRVMGDHILTFEELSTLFIQIEAQLNSRPLTPLYEDDLDNMDVLTPGHFLIGSPLVALPEPSLRGTNLVPRDRWHLITKIQQDFWFRWHRDYLNNLQQRKKWHSKSENFKINDLVLIKEDNLPPASWALGRIQEVHPGPDGLVRVATIKTAKNAIKRPITKLIKLPVTSEVNG